MKDVIAAIATPPGRGAIGIVRMSGEGVLDVLKKVWKSDARPVEKFITHRLYLGKIVELSTGNTVDKVFACLMKGLDSYNGEDIVEINCHGGPVVVGRILEEVVRAGARVAEPGEFTRRAFLNGKVDLVQAEAVASLINSRSARSAIIAGEQLEGRLSEAICGIRDGLKKLLAYVEASIDFPEEDIEFMEEGNIGGRIDNILEEVERLLKSHECGRVFCDGVKAVIAGPPNAGKSSLLNAIVGKDRAIVHHEPGTTRDTIETEALLDGVPFRFIDTAGIRDAEAEVEELGVSRGRKEVSSAEVVVLVVDGSNFVGVPDEFLRELGSIRHVVVVINKADLGLKDADAIKEIFKGRPTCSISAKTGAGVEGLKKILIGEMLGGVELSEDEGPIVTSVRHFGLLKNARQSLGDATLKIKGGESAEFIAIHLKAALDELGRIVGDVTTDDILDEIFSRFCVGK